MRSSLPKSKLPTLRTIEDVRGAVDLEKVINLSELYSLGVDNGNEEHIARMGHWHPSSVGYCGRRGVLAYTSVMPTDLGSKKLKQIFEYGHAVHDIVQTRYESLGPLVRKAGAFYEFQREVTFDPETDQLWIELNIGGTADGVLRIWNADFEQRGILEVKSHSDEFHLKLMKISTPFENHNMQAHIYAYRFNLPIMWFHYVNKSNAKREIRLQLFDNQIFDAAILYFQKLSLFVDRGELPPREESWFECSECPYRTMCNPSVLRGKRAFPSVPVKKLRRR